MVCSNCKSTDIVSIQGVSYCINCGQKVTAAAELTPVAKTVVTTKASPVIKTVNSARAKAKPIAVSQEAPQIKIRTKPKATPPVEKSSLIINHPTVSTPKINVKPEHKEASVAAIPARASSKAAPLDLRSQERKQVLEVRQAMLGKQPKAPARLSDVRPKRSVAISAPAKPAVVPVLTEDSKPAVSAKSAAETQLQQPLKTAAVPREGSALLFAWKQLGNWRFLALALVSGLLAGVSSLVWRLNVDTVSVYDALLNSPARLIGSDLLPTVLRFGSLWLGLNMLSYAFHVFITNAIAYGAAKLDDGHPVKLKTWIQASVASLPAVLAIDLLLWPLWLALAAAEVALVAYVGFGGLPFVQQALILVVANLAIVYAALGAVFVRLFGGYSVVLGDQGPIRAIAIGWRLYRSRTLALAVCGSIAATASSLIYLPALALNYANRDLPAEVSGLGQVLGAYGFTAVLWSLVAVFVTTYFMKHYRRSVLAVFGTTRSGLLSGRKAHRPTVAAKMALVVIPLLPFAVVIAGFMGTGTISPVAEELLRWVVSL